MFTSSRTRQRTGKDAHFLNLPRFFVIVFLLFVVIPILRCRDGKEAVACVRMSGG